jgi:triphosphatase
MPTNSSEFEIKLLFPDSKLEPIEKWMISKGGVRRQHLQAAYIDTPDFLLTQAGIVLRLRKEGRQWIQTLKVATNNPLERLEHNIVLGATGNAIPKWNLDMHHHTKSGQLLKKRFPKLRSDDLKICYRTDIWRRRVVVNTRQGILEYALDKGSIYSQLSNGETKTPVQELEIELKEGDPRDVLNHAQSMIKSHGAYIDTRSKSERGYLLASGLEFSPPTRAKFISLKGMGEGHEIVSRLIHSCMQQVLANQSVLNAEFKNYSEYLHQLRVGLRRLKVLFKYLAKQDIYLSDKEIEVFKRVFAMLGQYRDNDYVTHVLNPTLLSLGGPEIKLGEITELPNPSRITRGKEFQLLLLEIMSLGLTKATPIVNSVKDGNTKDGVSIAKKSVAKLLDSGFRFVSDRVSIFASLKDEEVHLIRKKMKFIRYSLDFFKDYCIKKTYPKFFKSLTVTLDFFGLFNDICVAANRIESLAQSDPDLLFALGWLKAERQRVRGLCGKSVKKLIQAETPWR